jgi:microcystin-dependent protein
MEGYIAEIRLFAANFAPRNWSYCQGQILSIASNTALFSLLGTTYGGNGVQTFALPNFASRLAVGTGQTQGGIPQVQLGEMAGTETVTLFQNQLPSHTHTVVASVTPKCYSQTGDETNPNGAYVSQVTTNIYVNSQNTTMLPSPATVNVNPAGGSMPHQNIQPSLGMNYIICLYGIFPSRN